MLKIKSAFIIPNVVFSFPKVPYGKQLSSCKKSDQNVEKNQSYETFYIDIKFCRRP